MSDSIPHYLLFCDSSIATPASNSAAPQRGHWRFTLENIEEQHRLEASDSEPETNSDRIALTAVVRGLEAIPESSTVTLVTNCKYVHRGLQYGIAEWRENEYCWEHFGTRQPVRNADLWRRIDRAMQFHSLRCRLVEPSIENIAEASQSPEPAELSAVRNQTRRLRGTFKLAAESRVRWMGKIFNNPLSKSHPQMVGRTIFRSTLWLGKLVLSLAQIIVSGPIQILANARASIAFIINETFGSPKSKSTHRIST